MDTLQLPGTGNKQADETQTSHDPKNTFSHLNALILGKDIAIVFQL